MAVLKKHRAFIAFALLSVAVFGGFLQVDYNKELELHRQCLAGKERIEQIRLGITQANEALIEAADAYPNPNDPRSPEERQAAIDAFKEGVERRLNKTLPPRVCDDSPTFFPWEDL